MTTKRGFPLAHRKPGLWPALWLALCLLVAQHAGLAHRIAHGGMLYGLPTAESNPAASTATDLADATSATEIADVNDSGDTSAAAANAHSCVLFDGAAVVAAHCGAPVLPALSHGKPVLAPNIARHWTDLPRPAPFNSRAPPPRLAFA